MKQELAEFELSIFAGEKFDLFNELQDVAGANGGDDIMVPKV